MNVQTETTQYATSNANCDGVVTHCNSETLACVEMQWFSESYDKYPGDLKRIIKIDDTNEQFEYELKEEHNRWYWVTKL